MGLKEILVGIVSWVILLLILILPLSFLFIWKMCVILVAKCIRRDLQVVGGLDIMNALGNGDIQSIISFGLVLEIDGQIEVEDIRNLFAQKFLGPQEFNPSKFAYERLHCALVTFGGFSFFKTLNNVPIKEMIIMKNINEKEDGQTLEDLMSEWILTRYRKDSPCWEIILVPMRATNQTVVAMKIHHAFADGYSALYILDQLTENTSPYLVKDFTESCGKQLTKMLEVPSHMDKFKGNVENNPFACKPVSPPQWSISFTQLDLDTLKKVRRVHNVQFGSIILSLLGGSLKRYLIESGSNPSNLPSHFCMGTTLPWPRHPSRNPQTSTNQKICNHWVTALVNVPIGEESAVERLLETNKSLVEFENLGLHKFMKWVMAPLMGLLPISLLRSMVSKDIGFAAGYSTQVGGDNYKLLGKDVTRIHPILAIPDANPFIGISTISFTHSNLYELTFAANPQHFPDRSAMEKVSKKYLPEELLKLAAESIKEE